MKAWRRTEPRIARPFFAVSELEDALDSMTILVGDRETEIEEDSVQLDPADFKDLHIAICPKLESAKLREVLGDRAKSFSVILALRDPMFKRRAVHQSWAVTEGLPDRLPLDEETIAKFGHKRELHVTLAVILGENLASRSGWPNRKGAWIAKRTFKIKLRSIRSTFDLQPMTRQQALHFTDAEGALLHVDVNGGLLAEEPDEGVSLATCYIAEEVYNAMQRTTDGPVLQELVMAEIVYAVLAAAADDVNEINSAPKGTPLFTILEQLGKNASMSLDQLKAVVRDPVKLRALVHDRIDFVQTLRSI